MNTKGVNILNRKHWIAILLTVAMLLGMGGMAALATENVSITITVLDIDKAPVEGAAVTVLKSGYEPREQVFAGQTGADGKFTFSVPKEDQNYDVDVEKDGMHAGTGFGIWPDHDGTPENFTVYLHSGSEEILYYDVWGPIGVSLQVRDGHHRGTAPGVGKFAPNEFELHVYNSNLADVVIEVLPIEHWGLKFGELPGAGELAFKYEADYNEVVGDEGPYWVPASDADLWAWFPLDGIKLDGIEGHTHIPLWVQAYVHADTQEVSGAVLFRATATAVDPPGGD